MELLPLPYLGDRGTLIKLRRNVAPGRSRAVVILAAGRGREHAMKARNSRSAPQPPPEHAAVRLDELRLAPQWRAWLLARVTEEGSVADALRAVVAEAALVDVVRMQYEKEAELSHRLHAAGHAPAEVRRLIVRWRLGERIEGVAVGPPAAARILHPAVVSRVPQVWRARTADARRKQARSSRRSGGNS